METKIQESTEEKQQQFEFEAIEVNIVEGEKETGVVVTMQKRKLSDHDDENIVPDEEGEGFDNNIQYMIDRGSKNVYRSMPEETYSSNKMSSKCSEEDYHVVPKSETKSSKMKEEEQDLQHNGEDIISSKEGVIVFPAGNKSISVQIILTKLCLYVDNIADKQAGKSEHVDRPKCLADLIEKRHAVKYLTIPIFTIMSIQTVEFENFNKVLLIKTKDYKTLALSIMPMDEQNEFEEIIRERCFPGREDLESCFFTSYSYTPNEYFKSINEKEEETKQEKCNKCKINPMLRDLCLKDTVLDQDGWEVFNFDEEFARQGVTEADDLFRYVYCWREEDDKNKSVTISELIHMLTKQTLDTYPKRVYVPGSIKDEDLAQCAIFRSKFRFPALSYYHKKTKSSIWRSAQNQTGMFGKRSDEDELMLRLIGETNRENDEVLILDARSKIAAQGNRIMGGGFEQETYYTNCQVIFGSIDNIHGVRSAYQICFPNWDEQWYLKNYDEVASKINISKWHELISIIIKNSVMIAETIDLDEKNVLVHCSDGWDRTAQLCCISEILLDPYYRTLKGFEVLIEKRMEFLNPFYNEISKRLDPSSDNLKLWKSHFLSWNESASIDSESDSVQPFDGKEEAFTKMFNETNQEILALLEN